jgi:hypothetical protein
MPHELFSIKDCALISRAVGLAAAATLRELRARVEACPCASLYHHFCETKLRPSFDDPEYPNDLAAWAAHALRDAVLGERLAMIDGFEYEDLEILRADTLDVIDQRLGEAPSLAWAQPDENFEFMQAMTVVFDTGACADSIEALTQAVDTMSNGSIYFHFVEARRRPPWGKDDFSTWISTWDSPPADLAAALSSIDFRWLSLHGIKTQIHRVFTRALESGAGA